MVSRSRWQMSQQTFNKHLKELTGREKEVLQLLLKGKSDPEIQKDLNIAEGTVRANICHIYDKFEFLDEMKNREDLIRVFCKFKREWVNHRFRDEYDRLRVDDYLDIENIRSDDSNFRLIEGTEYL
jgi:DNA-binding CsgD family transcriptional regulator